MSYNNTENETSSSLLTTLVQEEREEQTSSNLPWKLPAQHKYPCEPPNSIFLVLVQASGSWEALSIQSIYEHSSFSHAESSYSDKKIYYPGEIVLASQTLSNYHIQLLDALEEDFVDDGEEHIAESILIEVLNKYPYSANNWIYSVFRSSLDNPIIVGGLLKCLSRIKYDLIKEIAHKLIESTIDHPSLIIRSSAINAVERWKDVKLLNILKSHLEIVPWLSEYNNSVIKYVSEY